jgi:N-carbamoyl-L-amino-acid hydrolase
LRHPDSAKLAAMDAVLRKDVANIAEAAGLEFDLREIHEFEPIVFDEECVSAVREAAVKLGHSHRDIVSGAGHDACNMSRVAPTAMVFTPCVDGISHNEVEDMKPEWATAGAEVLMHAVLEIADIVEGEDAV